MSNPTAVLPLPPHPEIRAYYRTPRGKREFLRDIFDETSGDYDKLEGVLSLGSGRKYRNMALRRAGLSDSMCVLDVATGTGLVAREALAIVGKRGSVIGLDPSANMLREARSLEGLTTILGVGESLPFANAQFDFLSMGYALRHLGDLRRAFREYFRVLRPGGRICLLEISRPAGAIKRGLMSSYFQLLLPILARTVTRSPQTARLWKYYWETIDQCVKPEVVLSALRDAGFIEARRHLAFGLFSEFIANRPA